MGKSNLRFLHIGPHGAHVEKLHQFYAEQRNEHLYPRTEAELSSIADEGAMFAVEHGDSIVAACYVKWQDEELRKREFGGICVGPKYLGLRISSTLSCVAIGQALVFAETSSLLANVHIDNDAPNSLLKRLGFERTPETVQLPPEGVRSPMKPSEADGSVTGCVWKFDFTACRHIAERLRGFPLRIGAFTVMLDLGESVGQPRAHLLDLASELENIALEREMND